MQKGNRTKSSEQLYYCTETTEKDEEENKQVFELIIQMHLE